MKLRFPARYLHLATLLALAAIAVVAGYWGWHLRIDNAPLPRPDVNAPFIRTPEQIVDDMLALAGPREDELLYDLGCGDGRIVVRAAEKYGCRAVGFDIDPQRVQEARENARRRSLLDRVAIVEQNIFTLDLAEADVVTLYLLPRMNQKLIPQLKQLKPGARVVSHEFDLPGIVPDKVVPYTTPDGATNRVLYLWTAPLRAAEQASDSDGRK